MLSGDNVDMFEHPLTQDDWKQFKISSLEEERMMKSQYLPTFKQLAQSNKHDTYTFVVNGAGHMDFCDSSFGSKSESFVLRNLVALGAGKALGLGTIDGFRVTEIVNAYLVNFFDKYLKNKPSELLDGGIRRYEEVEEI